MRIRFSKRQKTTMLTLYAVAGILICSIFLLPWVNTADSGTEPNAGGPAVNVPAGTVPHDPFRAARTLSYDPSIAWETNLGGSGEEDILAAYPIESGILLFGNTDSADYDFAGSESAAYFIILLDYGGKPVHYQAKPGTLAAVEVVTGGFLLCINTDTEGILVHTDSLGIETDRATLSLTSYHEKLIAVYVDCFNEPETAPYHAVVECTDSNTGNRSFRLHILNEYLDEQYRRNFPRSQDMSYLSAFSFPGGFYLFANIVTPKSSILTYYAWERASSSDADRYNLNLSLLEHYVADAVLPFGANRYALLVRSDRNIPYLVDCKNNFTAKPAVHILSEVPAEKTALFADGDNLVVYLYSVGDISEVSFIGREYSFEQSIPALKSLTALYCQAGTPFGTLYCGQTSDSILIAGIGQNETLYQKPIQSKTETVKAAFYTDDGGLIFIGASAGTSLNIGGNFGKKDIWACKVML